MIAHVVFPERRPRALGAFDYIVPLSLEKNITPGTGVETTFRTQKKIGVVFGLSKFSNINRHKLKKITSIISSVPLVTQHQLTLIRWLSHKTGSSLSTTLNAFLPEKPLQTPFDLTRHKPRTTKKQKSDPAQLHLFDTYDDMYQFCSSVTRNAKNRNLIIVPDAYHIQAIAKRIPDSLIYFGLLKKKQKFDIWRRVHASTQGTVIGTRHAMYLPYHSLDALFLLREESHVFLKQEQHPDYDALEIASKLADIHSAKLSVFSFAPRTTTYHRFKNSYSVHHSKKYPNISLIDKQNLVHKHQSSVLPEDLLVYMRQTSGMHVLLYNRKGRFRYFNCEDCEWQAVCDTCGTGLIQEDEIRGQITCRVCKHQQQLALTCPLCSSVRIRSSGAGIAYYNDKITKAFPERKVIHSYKESGLHPAISHADIVIGTQFMLSFLPFKRIASFTIVDTDITLNAPDYRAHEWTLQRLRHIAALLASHTKLFALTNTPDHPVCTAFVSRDLLPWYSKECKARHKLSYPPFSHLFMLKSIFPSAPARDKALAALHQSIATYQQSKKISLTALTIPSVPEHYQKGWPGIIHLRVPSQSTDTTSLLQTLAGTDWSWRENPLDLYG